MRTPKIYIETTIFNHYFDTDRDSHPATLALFDEIKSGKYKAYTAPYVVDELKKAHEPKRTKMLNLITDYDIIVLTANDETQQLADSYIYEGIIPDSHRYDSLHIASATVNELDFIISMNYQHINRHQTKTLTSLINAKHGYKPITILTPMEVVDHENQL